MDAAVERFRNLYRAEAVSVLGYFVRRVERREDAADLMAEAFVVVWRRIGDVPVGADARPWLFGVARNVLLNHRRGAGRQVQLADRLRRELMTVPVAAASAVEELVDAQRALGRLPENDRELLLLAIWEGLTPTEVALVMGIPAGTARSRLHRVRRLLRLELGADDLASSPGAAIERCSVAGQVVGGDRGVEEEETR